MNAFQGRKMGWVPLSMAALLAASLVSAQKAPPPLPPLPAVSVQKLPPRAVVTPAPAVTAAPLPAPSVAAVTPAIPAPPKAVASPPPSVPTVIPAAVGPVAPASPVFSPVDANVIKWDAETKEYSAKPGEAEAKFQFWLTNVSPSEV